MTVATPGMPARISRSSPIAMVSSATTSSENGIASWVCFVAAPTRITCTGSPSSSTVSGAGIDVSSPSSAIPYAESNSATVSEGES